MYACITYCFTLLLRRERRRDDAETFFSSRLTHTHKIFDKLRAIRRKRKLFLLCTYVWPLSSSINICFYGKNWHVCCVYFTLWHVIRTSYNNITHNRRIVFYIIKYSQLRNYHCSGNLRSYFHSSNWSLQYTIETHDNIFQESIEVHRWLFNHSKLPLFYMRSMFFQFFNTLGWNFNESYYKTE